MKSGFKVRVFNRRDSERVIKLISNVIVNEFRFKLEFDSLDYDIICIEEHYNIYNADASGLLKALITTPTIKLLVP